MMTTNSNNKRRFATLLVIGALIFLTTVGAVLYGMIQPRGEFTGVGTFKMFTTDSNILSALVSLILCGFAIARFCGWRGNIPRWVTSLSLAATTGVMLTFIIAAGFLGPMMGPHYLRIFAEDTFFLHLLNPLLAAINFIFFLPSEKMRFTDALIGIVPMVIYSAVYTGQVLSGKWFDFYGFTFGGHYEFTPVILVVMYGLTFLISFLLMKTHNRVNKNNK